MARHDGDWVPANPDLLGYGWQWDEVMRGEVRRKIRVLTQEGYTTREIARKVGCSDRTVIRWRKRL